ncbi:hypothetical protein [Paraburkholderia bryophila]|nr:hypothetical protein [Paraburkholderia bryophila]
MAERATLWELREPAHLFGEGFSREMRALTTLSRYLEFDTWTPEAAAMLICGLQAPIIDGQLCVEIPEKGAMGLDNCFITDSQDPFHEAKRVLGIWRSQENPPTRVRLLEFIRWCQTRGFDTSWLRSIEEDAVNREREVALLSPDGLPVKEDGQTCSSTPRSITKHAIGTRSNPLRAVIEKAKSSAADPSDIHSVWASLVKLAQNTNRPAPLLGYADVEGVKWDANGTVKFFTKKNLADRMRRANTR